MLRPLQDSILFTFIDPIRGIMFVEETDSGIFLGQSHQLSAAMARWATVLAIGPKVKNIVVGTKVLIEPLQWTIGFTWGGVRVWKSDASKVLAIMED